MGWQQAIFYSQEYNSQEYKLPVGMPETIPDLTTRATSITKSESRVKGNYVEMFDDFLMTP
jgi:hypothetical protein